MEKLPSLTSELIRQLDADEGQLTVSPGMSMDKIMFQAGRRSLIDELLIKLEESKEEHQVLEGH